MKITGTNSYIRVELDGKIVKIEGEMIIGGFIAYKDTINKWEGESTEEIDNKMREKIIKMVTEETQNSHMKIIFE